MSGAAPLVRTGDPNGPFRRRIRVRATSPGEVRADLEDDFHRFGVVVYHEGKTITGIETSALSGTPLVERFTQIAKVANPRANCTHLFDLSGLAELMTGICFTMQPGTVERARRNLGVIRDFATANNAQLTDVADA